MSRLPGFLLTSAALLCAGLLHAATSENMAERTLKRIVERQREIFATAAKQGEKMDESSVRVQLQGIVHEYELLLRDNPNFAAGYAAYGYLLGKVDMRKEAAAMLLKAKDRKSTRLNSSHTDISRMPSSA